MFTGRSPTSRQFPPGALDRTVAWAGAHQHVTCPIIGARNLEQLQPSLDFSGIEMTPDLWREIAGLGRPPAPATDRLEEQK